MSEKHDFPTMAFIDGRPLTIGSTLRVTRLGLGSRNVTLPRLVQIVESDEGWAKLCELMGSDV